MSMTTKLPPLPTVQRLSTLCVRILGGNPGKFTLQGTNTYLLGTGTRRILIDAGEGRKAWTRSLESVLRAEGATIETVLITHWHHDHAHGAADVMSICPDALIYKYDPSPDQEPILDGQRFQVDGVTLTAVHTPGHAKDHMVFTLAEEDALFTGDNVLGHGTVVFEDLSDYLDSLHRMRQLFAGRAYPGHGPVIENGPSKVDEYIKHRSGRMDQMLEIMNATANDDPKTKEWSAMELARVIYHDVSVESQRNACIVIKQMLEKLCGDGMVVQRQYDRWELLKYNSYL